MLTQEQYDAAIAYACKLGDEHGNAAGPWVFDGNTPDATYAHVLRMLDDGDPAVYDALPGSPLSGEWADGLTPVELVRDALDSAGFFPADMPTSEYDAIADDVCSAYEDAWNQGMVSMVEHVAAQHVNA